MNPISCLIYLRLYDYDLKYIILSHDVQDKFRYEWDPNTGMVQVKKCLIFSHIVHLAVIKLHLAII